MQIGELIELLQDYAQTDGGLHTEIYFTNTVISDDENETKTYSIEDFKTIGGITTSESDKHRECALLYGSLAAFD